MFDFRNKLIPGLLFAWILVFAVGATVSIPQVVSPRLESIVRQALDSDDSLKALTPKFEGLTGSFTGTLPSAEHLERAYSLAVMVLPAGSFRRQPVADLVVATPPAPLPPAPPIAAETKHTPPPPVASVPAPQMASAPKVAQMTQDLQPVATTSLPPLAAAPEPAPQTISLPPSPSAPVTPSPVEASASPEPEPSAAPTTAPQTPAPQLAAVRKPTTAVYVPEEWNDSPPSAASSLIGNQSAGPVHSNAVAVREVDEWTGTVFFDPDSSTLHDSQLPILRRIVEDSKSRPDFHLRIISFADPRGDQEFNTWLSQRRAERVRTELAAMGVPLEIKLTVDFESPTSPILDHPEIQRRVELRYIR